MMEEVHQAMNDLGYTRLTVAGLENAVNQGSKSMEFTALVSWIATELQVLYSLEDNVNATSSPDDSSAFLMELSSFLKEIGCQYSILLEGHVNERLNSESNKILLLDYLLTELKSAKMIRSNKPDAGLQVTLNESSTAVDMKSMLQVLQFPKPPANIPATVLFGKVEAKLKEVTSKVPVSLFGEPLFVDKLSDKQWHILEDFHKELLIEYKIRKELLLKRLDVTIQSFEWSDRLKKKSTEIYSVFRKIRDQLTVTPNIRISDVLAARKDLSIIEKTSSASVRRKTQSDVNKVVIGAVPDRGGRPYEQEPPPPEMPSWQQRSSGGGGPRGGGGGSRGGGRGNFHNSSGGRGAGPSDHNPGNFDQSRTWSGPPRGGRVQAGWNAPHEGYRQEQGYQNYNQGNQYQGHPRDHEMNRSNFEHGSGGRGQRQNYDQDFRDQRHNYHQNRQDGGSHSRSNYRR